jgi:hypothetical protein
MVAIAVLALFLWTAIEVPRLWILHERYSARAANFGYWQARYHANIQDRQEVTRYAVWQPRGPAPSPARLAQMKAMAAYYSSMRAKYEHAARFPWQPLAPDPPPPL